MTNLAGQRCSNLSIKCIYKALFTSADVTKCYTETEPKTPNSKQCRCSTVARKNSPEGSNLGRNLERNQALGGGQSSSGCGQDVQMIIGDQQGQIIIIITVVVEGSTGVNVSWLFIADHSELEIAGAVERVENNRSGTR